MVVKSLFCDHNRTLVTVVAGGWPGWWWVARVGGGGR